MARKKRKSTRVKEKKKKKPIFSKRRRKGSHNQNRISNHFSGKEKKKRGKKKMANRLQVRGSIGSIRSEAEKRCNPASKGGKRGRGYQDIQGFSCGRHEGGATSPFPEVKGRGGETNSFGRGSCERHARWGKLQYKSITQHGKGCNQSSGVAAKRSHDFHSIT